MVYKSCPEKDVGSITSTNACFRNAFAGVFCLVSGYAITWGGQNYMTAFALGQIVSSIGMVLFFVHAWLMRTGPPPPPQIAVDNGAPSDPAHATVMPVER